MNSNVGITMMKKGQRQRLFQSTKHTFYMYRTRNQQVRLMYMYNVE